MNCDEERIYLQLQILFMYNVLSVVEIYQSRIYVLDQREKTMQTS